MQQATNAQREPSMEEILASIRRIIEDSDAARRQTESDVPAAAAPKTASPEPAIERPRASVIDVDAFRAELRGKLEPEAKPALVAAPAAQEAPKPKTLAEVQAEIMRGTRRQDLPAVAPVEKPAVAAVQRETAPVVEQPRASRIDSDVSSDRPVQVAVPPAPVAERDFTPAEPPAILRQEEPPIFADNPKPAIISAHAGRQVAAAFGELSEAFAESRKKSFDEMAEQMLRPMLQDWLDNNLPTLVERLVREEIERVARGG
jgi:cell pole-organizing protein PopZ